MKKRITMDFETRSKSNLKLEGAFKYSLDPTTQPTCLAIKVHGVSTMYFLKFELINTPWKSLPEKFKTLWLSIIEDEEYLLSAHNAFFERCIYDNILVKRYGWPKVNPRRWRCTAAKAASCALPRNLQGAGEAMGLAIQKDKLGYDAMMKTCKPTRAYNAWVKACEEQARGVRIGPKKLAIIAKGEPPLFLEYADNPAVWETLYRYCKIDVRSEEELDDSLPDLNETEQEIWFLNQKLNWRGLRIDIPTVQKIIGIMGAESSTKLKELDALTLGLITKPGARKSILEFLEMEDVFLPDIRAKTVEDVLKGGNLSEDAKKLLEIRQALSKTSTKKYQSFVYRAWLDGKVRDILLYHGASTGRDTGTGIQPHNFPRGALRVDKLRPYDAIENIVSESADTLKALYGESLGILFSSVLRNVILPAEGYELFVGDFSKIEVAVLWYLSGNYEGLEILNSGKDPYIYQAAANTGKTYEEIETAVKAKEKWAEDARQLGKAQILGCGFRMSWKRFRESAWDQYRLRLSVKQSKAAVKSYRDANEPVTKIWDSYETCAIAAVENPGQVYKAGKCRFIVENGFLWIELPSKRRLAYRDPCISWRVLEYEDALLNEETGEIELDANGEEIFIKKYSSPRKTLEFFAVNSKTKKWNLERSHGGVLTENIVQATARDLMMENSLELEAGGYEFLLSVHDECITQRKIGSGSVKAFSELMGKRPWWAGKDLPIQVEAWSGPRYRK